MVSDTIWQTLRERCEAIGPDEALVTPQTDRVFAVTRTDDEHVVVRFRDDGERRLRRTGFDALLDSLAEGPLAIEAVPPGVELYVTVVSLLPSVAVDEAAGELSLTDSETSGSPFVRPGWELRRTAERVHDDALLVADWLERHDAADHEDLPADPLVDLYVLLSDVQWGADELRREVGTDLLDHVGPEGRLHGQFGSVSRVARERRSLKPEDVVLEQLDEAGVPRDWVLGIDREKLDVVVATTDIDEGEVYDTETQYYVQKTGVADETKRARLEGLRDRLAGVDDERADELREEIDTLEDRIDDVLAAG